MLRTVVIGASGYAGVELVKRLAHHPHVELTGLYVSANSQDAQLSIATLHGQLRGICEMPLQPLTDPVAVAQHCDVVFLATDHAVSLELVPIFMAQNCTVFDLSGAYRLPQASLYDTYYGFTHTHTDLLAQAVYGLSEWVDNDTVQKTRLFAVAGCYPTASQLALKPLVNAGLLDPALRPIINAISGVSGAGRKARLSNTVCEVSTQAYNLFGHRHTPEISHHLGTPVIFNAHLGQFKRGILATVTAKLQTATPIEVIDSLYHEAYDDKRLVRLTPTLPRIQDVEFSPFCDIGYRVDGQGYIVICSAIDNLLKGASTQALQLMNRHFGFDEMTALF